MLRTFRDNVGAMASPNLAILTIWKPLDGTSEESLGDISWLYYSKSEGVDYPPLNRSKINLDRWYIQFMLEEVHLSHVQKFAYGYDLCGLR